MYVVCFDRSTDRIGLFNVGLILFDVHFVVVPIERRELPYFLYAVVIFLTPVTFSFIDKGNCKSIISVVCLLPSDQLTRNEKVLQTFLFGT